MKGLFYSLQCLFSACRLALLQLIRTSLAAWVCTWSLGWDPILAVYNTPSDQPPTHIHRASPQVIAIIGLHGAYPAHCWLHMFTLPLSVWRGDHSFHKGASERAGPTRGGDQCSVHATSGGGQCLTDQSEMRVNGMWPPPWRDHTAEETRSH